MKKLNIKGRELRKIGFENDASISLAISLVKKHLKKNKKTEILSILEKIIINPEKYKNDPVFHPLIPLLTTGSKKKEGKKPTTKIKSTIQLSDELKDYVIYGKQCIEYEALNQMETAMKLPITMAGALMADAHSGYGLPIGGVLATNNAIIPYGVGMDIGCRMCMTVYPMPGDYLEKNRSRIKKILIEQTRFGQQEFNEKKDHPILEDPRFQEIKFLKSIYQKAYDQLGTSGHGNHFVDAGILTIENTKLGLNAGNYFALISHSGSRNFGAQIARHYTNLAKDKRMLPKDAQNLAWLNLDEEEGEEYWIAMNLAGNYAAANHQIIHNKLAKALGEKPVLKIENHHNFAWKEKLEDGSEAIIHRKGATPALTDSLGIIPGSMTTPAYIVKGKGNPLSLYSASHGAGRLMSRSVAKSTFSNKSLKQTLEKAGVELIGGGLDESPGAYKNIHKIMQYQDDLVEIMAVFHPKIVRMSTS